MNNNLSTQIVGTPVFHGFMYLEHFECCKIIFKHNSTWVTMYFTNFVAVEARE